MADKPVIIDPEQLSQIITSTVTAIMQQQHHQRQQNAAHQAPVNWSLLKTLCPQRLDINAVTRTQYTSWGRSFRSFMPESNIDDRPWETMLTALQTATTDETFARTDALRKQKTAAVLQQNSGNF